MSELSTSAQAIISYLDCDYLHFPEGSDPKMIVKAFAELFDKREEGGYTPVLFGIWSIFNGRVMFDDRRNRFKLREDILANEIDAEKELLDTLNYEKEYLKDDWENIVGEVGDGKKITVFDGICRFRADISIECVIAKIPVTDPWEVFAWYPFGGFNDCPEPEEMYWTAKYWYKKYKAVPILMTHDTLGFFAPRVEDKNAAMELAMEQFAFCEDGVFRNFETIGRLADSLTKSETWQFRWD